MVIFKVTSKFCFDAWPHNGQNQAVWQSWDVKEEFKVKNEGMYKFAQNFLQKEWVDYFIFGHRHYYG